MIKQLFHIEFETADDPQKVLVLQIGKAYLSFAITNKGGSELSQLRYYSFNEWNETVWQEIIDTNPALLNSFYEVLVSYDFPESMVVPFKEFKHENPSILLNIAYGINDQSVVISEVITGWQLYNIYAVPVIILDSITAKFPSVRSWHQYSLGVRNAIVTSEEGCLLVDFKKDEFIVLVAGSKNILLSQTFEYTNPEDVLFYLIRICNQFSLSRDTVQLLLSGLIDKQSSLYKELYQYFVDIKFRDAQWDTGSEYPAHYFTSLNDLAQCVS